jgi:hypothetical protein
VLSHLKNTMKGQEQLPSIPLCLKFFYGTGADFNSYKPWLANPLFLEFLTEEEYIGTIS